MGQSTIEKKPVSNLKSMQSVGFEQTSTKFIEIFILYKKFLYINEKNYEGNEKSMKAERCTDVMFKLGLYCLSAYLLLLKDLQKKLQQILGIYMSFCCP